MPRQLYTAELMRSVPLSDRTKHLEFRVRELECFQFTAGQFVSMKERREEKEVTRAYSIASPPRADNSFDLCLNRVDQGFFSNYLCDLEPGAEVKFHGPHGYFVMREPVRDSIFIATGTGIAPMRGMLQWVFAEPERWQDREFWLVFGNRMPGDIYYHDEFERLAAERPNFHYLPTLSRAGPEWHGLRGYVQEHVREIARERAGKPTDAYICGLQNMVTANRDLLIKELGWDKKAVMYERFD